MAQEICTQVRFCMQLTQITTMLWLWSTKFSIAASARVVSQFGPRIDAVEYEQIKQQFGI
jgi:hypothetical protein